MALPCWRVSSLSAPHLFLVWVSKSPSFGHQMLPRLCNQPRRHQRLCFLSSPAVLYDTSSSTATPPPTLQCAIHHCCLPLICPFILTSNSFAAPCRSIWERRRRRCWCSWCAARAPARLWNSSSSWPSSMWQRWQSRRRRRQQQQQQHQAAAVGRARTQQPADPRLGLTCWHPAAGCCLRHRGNSEPLGWWHPQF